MKRHSGGHMGTGDRFRLGRSRVATELPTRLLEAMGERDRDIARFMARYGALK